jgi:hypothetical protein
VIRLDDGDATAALGGLAAVDQPRDGDGHREHADDAGDQPRRDEFAEVLVVGRREDQRR